MKRKPIDIVADIINSLNGYQNGEKFNINSLKERSNIHWTTTQDYLNLIYFIQKFAPEIEITNQNKRFQIQRQSKYFGQFQFEEQVIIYLFLEKAFDPRSQIYLNTLFESKTQNHLGKEMKVLENSKFIRISKNEEGKSNIYLSMKGRFKAQGLISRINEEMANFIENPNKINLNTIAQLKIKPFRYEYNYESEFTSNQKMRINWESDNQCYNRKNDNDGIISPKINNNDLKHTESATMLA
ncbi:MAG: hypothetical protein ACTSWL_00215 [Promethearchaeota archaeon]